jgi:hypothetical protein
MLDDQLLEKYIHTFYGYGNYHGDFWFVGKEEGGGGTIEDALQRLNAWSRRGCRELEDVFEYHQAFGSTACFGQHPRIQPVWGKLIRSLLKAKGQEATLDQVRGYQGQQLAREGGETCLLELLPLPSPSAGIWLYSDYSQLPQLLERQVYRESYAAQRADHIRHRVLKYKPRAVVFYSLDAWYQQCWRAIAEGANFSTHKNGFQSGANGSTLFVIAKHPTAPRVTNEYFEAIGDLIAAHSSDSSILPKHV